VLIDFTSGLAAESPLARSPGPSSCYCHKPARMWFEFLPPEKKALSPAPVSPFPGIEFGRNEEEAKFSQSGYFPSRGDDGSPVKARPRSHQHPVPPDVPWHGDFGHLQAVPYVPSTGKEQQRADPEGGTVISNSSSLRHLNTSQGLSTAPLRLVLLSPGPYPVPVARRGTGVSPLPRPCPARRAQGLPAGRAVGKPLSFSARYNSAAGASSGSGEAAGKYEGQGRLWFA